MSPSSSVAEIAAELVQWELVPAERHNELQALVRECSDRLRWWRLLIERGLLTAYQVNALMNGQLSTLVLGPYRILDRLGSGPTGEVYKARHSALGRTCALKVVDVSKLNAPGLIERFFHEAKLAARLQHPNIVAVYDAGRDGQRCYYAMQYVEGKTLEQLVRDRGTLLAPTACEYVRQVASGLQYAADLGLVHGNLKPSNIVVSRDPATQTDVVKVMDFGLALVRNDLQDYRAMAGGAASGGSRVAGSGSLIGLDYLAPELLRPGAQADSRADIYSLGCTLYYLLAGRPPVADGDARQKILAIQQGRITPIQSLRPDVPPALVTVLSRMLAVQPEGRYQRPAEVAQALAPLAIGSSPGVPPLIPAPIGGGPVEPTEPPALLLPERPGKRSWQAGRQKLQYAVAGLVLTFLLGVGLAVWIALTMLRSKPSVSQNTPPSHDTQSIPKPPEETAPANKADTSPSTKPADEPLVPELPVHLPTKLPGEAVVTGKIRSVAVDPTGRYVAVLEELGQVNIYDFTQRRPLVSFPVASERHPLAVCWCGVHQLAVVFSDGVQLFDPVQRRMLRECQFRLTAKPSGSWQTPVAYSPYTEKLALVWNGTVVVVDCASMRYELVKGRVGEAVAIAFRGRTGSPFVLTKEGLYEAQQEIRSLGLPRPEAQAEALPVGTLSSDGRWAALVWRVSVPPRYRIQVWSEEGEPIVLSTPAQPQKLAFVSGASHLAVLYGERVTVLYDLARREPVLVQRSDEPGEKWQEVLADGRSGRAVIRGENRLRFSELLPEPPVPPVVAIEIVRGGEDPPDTSPRQPLPVPGEERAFREKLRNDYAANYQKLPASQAELIGKLSDHGRQAESAAEVLACGLEIAAICGQSADLVGLQRGIALLQDRLFAEPAELLSMLALEEFTSRFLSRNSPLAADKVLAHWEELAESLTLQLELEIARNCWRRAAELANRFPAQLGQRLAYCQRQVQLCTAAMELQAELMACRQALKQNAGDPQSQRLLGWFYVRRLERYARGFEHLAKCGEAMLERAAGLELKTPKAVPDMLELADAWVQAGQGVQRDDDARWYYERAAHWYRQAYQQQLRENAVLAPAIAERWKKAIARFPDLPGPQGMLTVYELDKWLQPKSLVGPVLTKGRIAVCAGRHIKTSEPTLLALHLDADKPQIRTWKLPELPAWLAGHQEQSILAIGLQQKFLWVDTSQADWNLREVAAADLRMGVVVSEGARFSLLVLSTTGVLRYPILAQQVVPLAVAKSEVQIDFGTFRPVFCANPNGHRLAAIGRARDGRPRVFLLDAQGKLLHTYDYPNKTDRLPQAAFSSDGVWLAAVLEKELLPFQAQGDKLVPQAPLALPQSVTAITAYPRNSQFLVGMEDGSVGQANIQTRQVMLLSSGNKSPVRGLVVDSERNQLLVRYDNGSLVILALPADEK